MMEALVILSMLVTFVGGYGLGFLTGRHRCRREIRRLQDIIMALDESGDEAAWLRRFGRER